MRPSSRSLWTQESALPTSPPCPKHCHFNLCPQQQQGWHKVQGWRGWETAHTTPDLCGGLNHTPVHLVFNLRKSLNVTQSQE